MYFKISQRIRQHEKSCPILTVPHISLAQITPSAALITVRPRPQFVAFAPQLILVPLPAKKVPNKLAHNKPNNMLRNPSFFHHFQLLSLAPFINRPDSSRYLTIFIISSISLSEIVNVPEPRIFSLIPASTAYAAAVSSRGIKILLANCLIEFFIIGATSLPRNPPKCIILVIFVFDSFVSGDELFAKALRSFETFLSVSNNLCQKLVLSLELPIIFDDSFSVTSVSFFVANFNLSSCEFDNFMFTL